MSGQPWPTSVEPMHHRRSCFSLGKGGARPHFCSASQITAHFRFRTEQAKQSYAAPAYSPGLHQLSPITDDSNCCGESSNTHQDGCTESVSRLHAGESKGI